MAPWKKTKWTCKEWVNWWHRVHNQGPAPPAQGAAEKPVLRTAGQVRQKEGTQQGRAAAAAMAATALRPLPRPWQPPKTSFDAHLKSQSCRFTVTGAPHAHATFALLLATHPDHEL